MASERSAPVDLDWRTTNPSYRIQPTRRLQNGDVIQDAGVRQDQLSAIQEWYRIAGVGQPRSQRKRR
jgi:hypothetical protein